MKDIKKVEALIDQIENETLQKELRKAVGLPPSKHFYWSNDSTIKEARNSIEEVFPEASYHLFEVRNEGNYENISIFLSATNDWEIKEDNQGSYVLIPKCLAKLKKLPYKAKK